MSATTISANTSQAPSQDQQQQPQPAPAVRKHRIVSIPEVLFGRDGGDQPSAPIDLDDR